MGEEINIMESQVKTRPNRVFFPDFFQALKVYLKVGQYPSLITVYQTWISSMLFLYIQILFSSGTFP